MVFNECSPSQCPGLFPGLFQLIPPPPQSWSVTFFPLGLLGQDWGTDLMFSLVSLDLLSVFALGESSICLSVS